MSCDNYYSDRNERSQLDISCCFNVANCVEAVHTHKSYLLMSLASYVPNSSVLNMHSVSVNVGLKEKVRQNVPPSSSGEFLLYTIVCAR